MSRKLVLVFCAVLFGCDTSEARARRYAADSAAVATADSIARARQDSVNRAQPGYIVDSILPLEEELRRFRAGIPVAPKELSGGAKSLDALVREFVRRLEARDSSALARLALTRAEFAWLVYPESPYTRPPYRQAPWLTWMMLSTPSGSGYARLLDRFAGQPLGFVGHECSAASERQGLNRVWRECWIRFSREPGDTARLRLFGPVIERAGHFKLVSFANDL